MTPRLAFLELLELRPARAYALDAMERSCDEAGFQRARTLFLQAQCAIEACLEAIEQGGDKPLRVVVE